MEGGEPHQLYQAQKRTILPPFVEPGKRQAKGGAVFDIAQKNDPYKQCQPENLDKGTD